MMKTERIKVTDNFSLDEFVDPYTYLFETNFGLNQIDLKIFQIAQKIRELYGKPLYINTWWATYLSMKENNYSDIDIVKFIENSNGLRKWSGLRTVRCDIGAKNSAHKTGQAVDLKGDGEALYKVVKNNAKELYCLGLRRIEDKKITKTWLHADTLERYTKPNSIRVVDLTKETETIYF